MNVAIYGGSFNPIHKAHVALASTICTEMALDEVWFLVSPHNPLKQVDGLADEHHRLEMTRIALRNHHKEHPDSHGRLIASDYEFHLPRPSYTWNTLQHLAADYPDYTFYIIIGADNWAVFDRWAHADDIIRHFHIIVYPRTGYPIDESKLPPTVNLVHTPEIDITSTQIRRMIAQGESIAEFVDEGVADYIRKNAVF